MDKKTRILKDLQRKEYAYTAFLAQQAGQSPAFKPFKNRDEIRAFFEKQGHGIIPLHVLIDGWEAHDYLQYFPASKLPSSEKASEKPEEKEKEQHTIHAAHGETTETEEKNTQEKEKPVSAAAEEVPAPAEPAPQEETQSTPSEKALSQATQEKPSSGPTTAQGTMQTPAEETSRPIEAMTVAELIQAHQEEVTKEATAKTSSPPATPKSAFEKIRDQQKRKDMIRFSKMTAEQLKTAQNPPPLAAGMELDARFKTIMTNIMRTTGFDINGLYISGKNGEEFLNPRIPSSAREQARMLYIKRHPREAKRYAEKEKTRVYPEEAYRQDPAVIKMDEETARVVKEAQRELFAENQTVGTTSPEADTLRSEAEKAKTPITEQFVRDFPEKARAYAAHDQTIREARERVEAENTQPAPEGSLTQPKTDYATSSQGEPTKTPQQGQTLPQQGAGIIRPNTSPPSSTTQSPASFNSNTATTSQTPVRITTENAQVVTEPPATTSSKQTQKQTSAQQEKHQNKSHTIHFGHPDRNYPSEKTSESLTNSPTTSLERRTVAPRLKRRWLPSLLQTPNQANSNAASQNPALSLRDNPSLPQNRQPLPPPANIPRRRRRLPPGGNISSPLDSVTQKLGFLVDPMNRIKLAVGIGLLLFFLLVFIGDFGGIGDENNSTNASNNTGAVPIPNLTIHKTSSDPACTPTATDTYCIPNDTDTTQTLAHYTITVNYSGSQDVVVTDTISTGDGEITDYSPQNATTSTAATPASSSSSSSACTFSRAGESASYSSPKLISYFNEVAQKTGVPASLLAALVRIESTTGTYSISNYTDDDIVKMEDPANLQKLSNNIDTPIDGTSKALCPVSPNGALGLTQLEPPDSFITAKEKSPNRTFIPPNAYDGNAIGYGASLAGLSPDNLTIQNYCDPRTNLLMAAGFILIKLQEYGYGNGKLWDTQWNTNKQVIDTLARAYYGGLSYTASGKTFSYGDDLYTGLNSCSALSAGTSSGTTTSTTASGPAVTATKTSISWHLKSFGSGPTYTFSLTVHPLKSDFNLQNKAIATASDNNPSTFAGGNGCPTQAQIDANRKTTPESCQYFNPSINIFDINISQEGLSNYIAKYAPQAGQSESEFIQRVNTIVEKSKAAGLNPMILLGYWKSESAFGSSLGCKSSSAPTFDLQVDCALGTIPGGAVVAPCALSHDANSPSCRELQDVRTKYADLYKKDVIKMPISTFDDFAEAYGSRDPNLASYEHVPVNNNCIHTYNELMTVALTLNACQAPPNAGGFTPGTSSTHPQAPAVNADSTTLRQQIIDQFGITMNGFDHDHLQWAWEKFYDISNTAFLHYVKGAVIEGLPSSANLSQQPGCFGGEVSVRLAQWNKDLYIYGLIHELGHVMHRCNDPASVKFDQHSNILQQEGSVSYYGGHYTCIAASQSSNDLEDYADMVAYYLIHGSQQQDVCHHGGDLPAPYTPANPAPLHYNLIKSILGPY